MRVAVFVSMSVLIVGLAGCRNQPLPPPPPPPPAPPPPAAAVAAVRAARKVFVLNGGEEIGFLGMYPYGPQTCYNDIYTAIAKSGVFQLVPSPADADLIVMIEGVQTEEYFSDLRPHSRSTEYAVDNPAEVVIDLLQPGVQRPIYEMSAVPSQAKKDPEKVMALAETIANLVNELDGMTETAGTPFSAADLLQAAAPVPPKVLAGRRIFVSDDLNLQSDFISGASRVKPFSDDLRASNRYTVLPTMQNADLILQLSFNRSLRVRVLDGATMNQLWTVTDVRFDYPGYGKKLERNEADGAASAFLALTNTP